MLLLTNLVFLLAFFLTGAFKRWRSYYPTALYVSYCNFLYNFLCKEHLTWIFHPDLLNSHKLSDLVNSFVLLPSMTFLYLFHYPGEAPSRKKAGYLTIWASGFSILEGIWYLLGHISYDRGWNLAWSIAFYFVMFYMIGLHHRSVGRALVLSLFVIGFLLASFRIPFWE
ncbi:CBO0543 family protein [Gorillibacterium sp. sgz5001074]|uniref:CBO0543 family protein n=1 Tax=Gorillibacterium sp. sgz5001074 TaxID=3446695 RepID=UPI003F67D605